MSYQNTLDTFILREDQDAFARSLGWEDAAQMIYYEDLALQEEGRMNENLDGEIASLAKVDSREVYSEEGPCPLALWYDTSAELH